MPDAWLNEEELKEHQKEVENSPLTKQAEEATKNAEKESEEFLKEQEELRKKVEKGELVEVRANGAVTGYRDADNVSDAEKAFAGGIKPKAEGRGGNPEDNETGPAGDKIPSSEELKLQTETQKEASADAKAAKEESKSDSKSSSKK